MIRSVVVRATPVPDDRDERVNALCHLFGHNVRTVQSRQITSYVAPDHWCWPGVISYCRRCDKIFKATGPEPDTGPSALARRNVP